VQQLTNLFGSGDCPVTPLVLAKGLELRTELAGLESPKPAVAIDLVAKKKRNGQIRFGSPGDLFGRTHFQQPPSRYGKPLFYRWIWSSSGINTTTLLLVWIGASNDRYKAIRFYWGCRVSEVYQGGI